jgi:hypothetical protein
MHQQESSMGTKMSHKPIEYALEIYKPQELQHLPAADECRHYHALTPFPAIHVGDHVNAWMWKFINDSYQDQVKAMGGRQVKPMIPVAVVTSVMHELIDTDESYKSRVVVFTRLFDPKADKR